MGSFGTRSGSRSSLVSATNSISNGNSLMAASLAHDLPVRDQFGSPSHSADGAKPEPGLGRIQLSVDDLDTARSELRQSGGPPTSDSVAGKRTRSLLLEQRARILEKLSHRLDRESVAALFCALGERNGLVGNVSPCLRDGRHRFARPCVWRRATTKSGASKLVSR